MSAVADLKVRYLERAIRITPVAHPGAGNLRLDVWGAHRKSRLLEDVAGRPVEIIAPEGEVFSSAAIDAREGE